MPIVSEQFQLSTRNTMVHPSVRQSTEEENDDLVLSEGENNDTAEMTRECRLCSSFCSTLAYGASTRLGQRLPFV